jgi:small subunit ribosomal protein S9
VTDETVVQEVVNETEAPPVVETPVVETPVVDTPETQPEPVPPVARQPDGIFWGTGRRKSSVARVRVKAGTGRILVNGREYKEFFPSLQYQAMVEAPLKAGGAGSRVDVLATLSGGGLTGQAGALSLGIARALIKMDPSTEEALRDKHLLTRDARMKERKKYGLHGARRGVQFSKR